MDMIKSEYAVANPGEGTLFLDQTETQRAEKNFWRPPPPLGQDRIGQDKCFIIINRAPTDTCVYNDNEDFRAIITEVYICKIYTTIKQGYI